MTDAQFSGWKLQLFWPFSNAGYLFSGAVGLDSPINAQFVYGSFVLAGVLAWLYKRTPLDMFSPELDQSNRLLCQTLRH